MIKACPNCGSQLKENGDCPKCFYSFSPFRAQKRGNAKIEEINSFIKTNLLKFQLNPEEAKRWVKSWVTVPKQNYVSGHVYRGVNRFIVAFVMDDFFLTRNQAEKLGGKIKENAKSIPVIFWLPPEKEEEETVENAENAEKTAENAEKTAENKKKKKRDYPIMQLYRVFGQHDVEGIPYKDIEINKQIREPKELVDFIRQKGARIEFYGSRACYVPSEKTIYVPNGARFTDETEFMLAIAHEFAHWVIDNMIRNKEKSDEKLDEKARAREEVAAEIAALYIASMFGYEPNENAVRYINDWLKVAENDVYALISATQLAEKVIASL